MHEKAKSFDPLKGGAINWIYTIGTNLAIDHLRKIRGKTYFDITEVSDGLLTSKEPTPEEHFFNKRRNYAVQREINNLPEKFKDLINLRYNDGFRYREIVDITGLPEGTVKSGIHEAKELLRLGLNAFS